MNNQIKKTNETKINMSKNLNYLFYKDLEKKRY